MSTATETAPNGADDITADAEKISATLRQDINRSELADVEASRHQVVLVKPEQSATLGLGFISVPGGSVLLNSICGKSIGAHSDQLTLGLQILSVNGVDVSDHRHCAELLKDATGEVRLVMQRARPEVAGHFERMTSVPTVAKGGRLTYFIKYQFNYGAFVFLALVIACVMVIFFLR